jgi:hypothetical protein
MTESFRPLPTSSQQARRLRQGGETVEVGHEPAGRLPELGNRQGRNPIGPPLDHPG